MLQQFILLSLGGYTKLLLFYAFPLTIFHAQWNNGIFVNSAPKFILCFFFSCWAIYETTSFRWFRLPNAVYRLLLFHMPLKFFFFSFQISSPAGRPSAARFSSFLFPCIRRRASTLCPYFLMLPFFNFTFQIQKARIYVFFAPHVFCLLHIIYVIISSSPTIIWNQVCEWCEVIHFSQGGREGTRK